MEIKIQIGGGQSALSQQSQAPAPLRLRGPIKSLGSGLWKGRALVAGFRLGETGGGEGPPLDRGGGEGPPMDRGGGEGPPLDRGGGEGPPLDRGGGWACQRGITITISCPGDELSAAPPRPAPDGTTFEVEEQQQDLWCWAAVAVSIDRYFSQMLTWSQCTLVSRVLLDAQVQLSTPLNCLVGRPEGCGHAAVCNREHSLSAALETVKKLDRRVHHLRPDPNLAPAPVPAFSAIKAELDAGRPLCVRIARPTSAHFVAISGYGDDRGSQILKVSDPLYGSSLTRYEDFPNAYHPFPGEWSDTYYVKG